MLAEAERSTTKKNRATEEKILDLNKKISESETTSGRKEDLAKANKKIGMENLDLKRIASELNVDIARAGEQSFAPFAPFSGRIEALFVSPGDFVTPGTPIATVTGNTTHSIVRAEVPSSLALLIDAKGTHTVTLPSGEKFPVTLTYLSKSAVNVSAFQATFALPDTQASTLGDAFTLIMTLALRTTADAIFIPLSAVEMTRDHAATLIEQDGRARQISVTPGEVIGNFIEITEGLSTGDRIILDRSIRPGDAIKIK
jgi:multidrug efflux pump subunit AcrA (membrane-fusion protein)